MRDTHLAWRREHLQNLGGLPAPSAENKEWLYLLKKETRNSIMVEGIFIKEKELEEVLFKGNYEIRHADDALNYFKTARFLYGLGFENFNSGEWVLSLGMIRQINKGVQEGKSHEPGVLRKGKVIIQGAEILPPEFDIDGWLRLYIQWVNQHYDKLSLLRFVALQHSFFEAVHPFCDGNGRTGRILTNYLLLSKGFPIALIKGDDTAREAYYQALQEADEPLNPLFRNAPDYPSLCAALKENRTEKLEVLFFKGIRESMDRLILDHLQRNGETLQSSNELAVSLGYSKSSIRKLVERGKLVAVLQGNTYMGHPSLFYGGD